MNSSGVQVRAGIATLYDTKLAETTDQMMKPGFAIFEYKNRAQKNIVVNAGRSIIAAVSKADWLRPISRTSEAAPLLAHGCTVREEMSSDFRGSKENRAEQPFAVAPWQIPFE